MAAMHSICGHYIFALWFLSSSFYLFFSPYIKYYNQLDSRTHLSPIPVRSAVKSYKTSWCIQDLCLLRRQSMKTDTTAQRYEPFTESSTNPKTNPIRLPVNSSHGHLVTGQLVTHTRLITQSTRHKQAHNKTTSTSRNYLNAVRRHPETVLNTDGVITAICVTLMYNADYRSRRQITLLQKARSTRHNALKHDGQHVT